MCGGSLTIYEFKTLLSNTLHANESDLEAVQVRIGEIWALATTKQVPKVHTSETQQALRLERRKPSILYHKLPSVEADLWRSWALQRFRKFRAWYGVSISFAKKLCQKETSNLPEVIIWFFYFWTILDTIPRAKSFARALRYRGWKLQICDAARRARRAMVHQPERGQFACTLRQLGIPVQECTTE